MKIILSALFSIFLGTKVFAQNTNITSFYEGPFEDVIRESKRLNRPIFIDFTANWCKHCLKMEQEAFANPNIAERLNTKFIAYKVELEDSEGMAIVQKYNVKDFPTYMIVDPNTNKIGRIKGFYHANEFITEINKILNPPLQSKPIKKKRKLFG